MIETLKSFVTDLAAKQTLFLQWQYSKIFGLAFSACFVTVLIAFQLTRSGWCIDESAHIPAGLYHLETGNMDAYRVNPPLPRMLAALPLLVAGPSIQWKHTQSPYARNEFDFAKIWIANHQPHFRFQLIIARLAILPFFLIGLWATWRWTSKMYGKNSAILASLMWSLSPEILTHASVVAPDLPATSMGLVVGYFFWDWVKTKSDRFFPFEISIAVGLAILCKLTWLCLLLGLPALVFANDFVSHRPNSCRDTLKLTASMLISILIVNLGYGFDGTGTHLNEFRFISQSLSGERLQLDETGNRFQQTLIGRVPVPIPREMMQGIDFLRWEFEQGYESYLRGVWSKRGWWYFYLYGMAIKMPLGYWILILVGLSTWFLNALTGKLLDPGQWVALVLACTIMALVSSQTGFTHHVRYVLPCFGFAFIVASRVLAANASRWKFWLCAICLAGTVYFHVTHLGLAHSFYNPLAGGPKNGWRQLNQSNTDWGQSTYRMIQWLEDNPEKRPLVFLQATRNSDPVGWVPPDTKNVFPDRKSPGLNTSRGYWLLTSTTQLTLNEDLWDQKPFACPYPDFHVYWVSSE